MTQNQSGGNGLDWRFAFVFFAVSAPGQFAVIKVAMNSSLYQSECKKNVRSSVQNSSFFCFTEHLSGFKICI